MGGMDGASRPQSPKSFITYISVRAPLATHWDRSLRISFVYFSFSFSFLLGRYCRLAFCCWNGLHVGANRSLYNTHTVLYRWTAGRHTTRSRTRLTGGFSHVISNLDCGSQQPSAYLWIMVDFRIQQAIADGKVPSDITAAYLSESRDRPSIIGIVFVTVLTFLVVVTRLVSRSFIVQRIGIDDVLAAVSLVSTCTYTHHPLILALKRKTDSRFVFFYNY